MTHHHQLRRATALLVTASSLSLGAPALAGDILFSSKGEKTFELGARVNQVEGLKQVRLADGAIVSVLNAADYRINADGSVDLYAGSVTVASGSGTTTVRMPGGIEGRVGGRAAAATFSVGADGKGRGHVLTGAASIGPAGEQRRFAAGEMFAFAPGERAEQVVSSGVQATPAAEAAQVADMGEGGPVAAAENGLPVTLGAALAAAGASSDILAAAGRIDAAVAHPAVDSFPSGDLALLVAGAAGLEGAYGGTPFPGAQADIIRTYLNYLAAGNSGADFLTAYAGFLGQYLDLVRSGAAPSSFAGASVADVNAFLAFAGRTDRLGALGASDRVLADAYLAFLAGGGDPDRFAGGFTDLTAAYFAFIRAGGDPADFSQASAATIDAYIRFLAASGLAGQLAAADRALLLAYLGNGGIAFAGEYRAQLDAYFAFLASGRLPSSYTALDAATLRAYLETLADAGLLGTVTGDRAQFFADYLAFLRGGGSPDAFAGLPANVFAGYAAELDAYFAFLEAGNLPSDYQGADVAELQVFIVQLQAAGALDRFLGARSEFFAAYLAFVQGGGNANGFARLNANIFAGYAQALSAYYAYLAEGGVPSAYGALTQETIATYLAALQAAGASNAFLADLADFYSGYFAFLAGGGNPDNFAGLPVPPDFPAFAAALNAYAAFLAGGGLPADYDAEQLATLQTYLASLASSGQLDSLLGANAGLLNAYFAHLAAGGSPNGFSGLPVYADYVSALNAYYAFLAGGGLPADYTALTPAQITAYLAALDGAGGFARFAGLDAFFVQYYAFVAGGGNPANFVGLPAYADYVAALNAYYAYLANGGLPAGYTALTQDQIAAYLAALDGAGGFAAYTNLNGFFVQYYAFIAGGGDPLEYAALPVYADYLAAVEAYYAFLLGGGVPSDYTALTQAQIETYLALLTGAGVLEAELSGPMLAFLTDYLAYLETGGDPDQFAGLPGPSTDPANPQYAGGFPSGATGARAYAVNAGVSYQASGSPQLDANGVLTDAGDLAIGTATAVDVAGDAAVVVGRYVDGAARFRGGNVNVGPNGGVPWVVTAPLATPLPVSGTIDYEILAATRPVFSSGRGGPGTFDANLTIGFSPSSLRYGFDGTIVMPEATGDVRYDFASEGRASGALVDTFTINPTFNMNGAMTGTGDACRSNGCVILFYGGFAGSEDRLGMTYQTVDSPNFQTAERIQGAVAFAAAGAGGDGGTGGTGGGPAATDGIAAAGAPGNYFLYAGAGGSGSATAATMTVTGGRLEEATSSRDSITYTTNTNSSVEGDGDAGVLGWSRHGNVSVDYRSSTGQSFRALPFAGQFWHSIWGTPVVDAPVSGLVNYELIGTTSPTQTNAQAGTGSFTGSFAVDFATLMAGIDADVAFNGETYSFASTGGVAAPSMAIRDDGLGARRFSENLETFTADGNRVSRGTFLQGFLAGQGASHAGISYSIRTASSNAIQGTAAFRAQPSTGTNPYARAPTTSAPIASAALPPAAFPVPAPVAGRPGIDWARWGSPTGSGATVAPELAGPAVAPASRGTEWTGQRERAERILGGLITFAPQR
ncbi:MAG: hypothetical protein HEQ22_08960 [Sphingopyxis sp.]|uniref:hypothetical protein n=1 Tax=Sphingopyxis sp. TaxID=1908224 RepID=UPI003D80F691